MNTYEITALSKTTMRWETLGTIEAPNEYRATLAAETAFGASHRNILAMKVAE